MGNEQMPDHALKCFAVRRDVIGIHRRHDDAGVSGLGGESAVATDNADD